MTKTMHKGSPEYSVIKNGVQVGRAHCVNVKANLFTLVIEGRWAGVASEALVVAKLAGLENKA